MSQLSLTRLSVLYLNQEARVKIYSGYLTANNTPVAIKEQIHDSVLLANSAINEAFAQGRLDHPHICKVFDCFLEQENVTQVKSVIVIELMANDLMAEIEQRQKLRVNWTEFEVISYLKDMSLALEYAETMLVSHRDIKPQNIFLTPNKEMKLGDFGSSVQNVDPLEQTTTLNGSPLFLSPELKKIFGQQMITGQETRTGYNPYRSDVYSLGLTFLYMSKLAPPVEFTSVANLQQTTVLALRELDGFQTLQQILGKMLEVTPETRWTFSQVANYCQSYLDFVQSVSVPVHQTVELGSAATLNPQYEAGNIDPSYQRSDAYSHISLEQVQTGPMYQVSQDYPPKIPKSCFVCQRVIESNAWVRDVPRDLEQYKHHFPDLCSVKCTRVVEMISACEDNGTLPCAGCRYSVQKQAVLESQVALLSCGHFFHNGECFAKCLERGGIDFLCPKCKAPITKELIESNLGIQRRLWIEKTVRSRLCDCCLLNAPATTFGVCGHHICQECRTTGFSILSSLFQGSNCPICHAASAAAKDARKASTS